MSRSCNGRRITRQRSCGCRKTNRKRSMERSGFFAVTCFVVGAFGIARAQAPAFEVASIKLSADVGPMMIGGPALRHGTLRAEKVTLRRLLAAAYDVTEPRIIGPDWLD